jgi:molecular chaperone Hsp33
VSDPLENHHDIVAPFLFEELPVRGALIQMKRSWARMQLGHQHGDTVSELLGQTAAATALIAQSLKFEGTITLQISGGEPLSMLVMQCNDQLELRGMANGDDVKEGAPFAQLMQGSRCAVIVDAGNMEQPYQGIVEIVGDKLADSFENYYARSAQIESHMVLVANRDVCGGILLQQMPERDKTVTDDWNRVGLLERDKIVTDDWNREGLLERDKIVTDDWNRLGLLGGTLSVGDIANGVGAGLIGKLFAEDDVRVFEQQPVTFRCRCSRQRAEQVLQMLGPEETQAALTERGRVDVTCEFCGKKESFDAVDVSGLFSAGAVDTSSAIH